VNLGYKGVCVAPGGRLAVNFVREKQPEAVLAVACQKELDEGVHGVREVTGLAVKPLIVIIPLLKDGCVDTIVDTEEALNVLNCGCPEGIGKNPG